MLNALSRVFKMLTQVNPNLEQDVDTIINAIGGMENLVETGACATRLRLTLKDTAIVNQKALKEHGAQYKQLSKMGRNVASEKRKRQQGY